MRENIPVIRLRTDLGDLMVRDGVALCFFMRRSHPEVAPALWRSLQTYLRAIPPQSLNWYYSLDGDPLPLDDKGWEYIRKKMLERPGAGACLVDLDEDCSGVGGYQFTYHGVRLEDPLFSGDEGATCGVGFTFPTEYLLEHGPTHLRTLALDIARELPFSFGYASLAFVSSGGGWYSVRKQLLAPLSRFLGMDLYRPGHTSERIGTGARGAYWLTFLGQPLLGQLGGLERLQQQLPFPEVSFQPLEGERLLLTLGEWPDAIDATLERPVPQYMLLAQLLEPFFPKEAMGWTDVDKENMRCWLRRLCP